MTISVCGTQGVVLQPGTADRARGGSSVFYLISKFSITRPPHLKGKKFTELSPTTASMFYFALISEIFRESICFIIFGGTFLTNNPNFYISNYLLISSSFETSYS